MISFSPFIPHSYQHLLDSKTFVPALPEKFYEGLLREHEALENVQTHSIAYENDGLKITGLFCAPKTINPAGHPVVIYNRGGRNEYGKLTLLSVMRSMAPFAEKGYLAFASNYRGNDGGDGHDEFGGGDVGDVLKLLSLAQNHEGFDGKNSFMVGHSRGGMMTYLSLKNGAKLNAAVSIAGISDLRGNGNFAQFIDENDKEEGLAARSAQAWPEALTTPLLLLHGTRDDAVGAEHSTQLAAQLAELGLRHELEIYEGGNHALVRHWDEVLARITGWLEEHRK
ncbi:MAG: S9 family peptidase [Alphaproteobacteria bacterium]|nr:S9 family peptidase [Alphaproteobacteria bacterium]